MATANGHVPASAMDLVFPEALKTLKDADPEVFGIIEDEKARQWCVNPCKYSTGLNRAVIIQSKTGFGATLASTAQRFASVPSRWFEFGSV